MWRRIVTFLFHRRCPAQSDAVEALFAEHLTANERAGRAADDVTRASHQTRGRLEQLRAEIIERTDADRRTRPQPHTSDVRALVEDVLSRPGLRGLPPNRDPS